ncbi:hypothetical protein WJX82_001944 [Trebouxia sp. C0006]
MPRENFVARILEQEGRTAAIPAGWLTVPPVVLKDPREPTPPVSANSQASTQGESAASVSFEIKNMTVLLRKPRLDISMWAGYDPNDGQKNLDYYKTWRFVVTPNNGNATMNDTYNKYQEWSGSARNGFVGPITCIQDLLDFYSWYISAEAMHGIRLRRDITRQANINAKEVPHTVDDGYEASDRKYLEDSEMAAISTFLWDSKSADDCILYNCFSSVGSQPLIRDTELLQLQRMRSSLSKSSQYQTNFGPLKLLEVVSKGVQKTNKTSYLYSWMIRRRQIDHLCPFFWTAARLFHDYQRMQPGQPGNQHGSLVEVIMDRPSVTIDRPSRSNPLTEVKRTQRSVANMMPLMSGRAYMRVGNGPMDSCFHHTTARNFSKQILQLVLGSKLLGIKERVKGASLRLLRQSAMRRMLFFGAEKHIVKGVSKHDPDNATAMDTFYALFCPGELLKCIIMDAVHRGSMRWLRHKADQDAWGQVKDLLTTSDGLVRGPNDNRDREAKRLIKKWNDSLFSTPVCLVSSVPELRTALKDYAKDNKWCLAKQGNTKKRNNDGTLKISPQFIDRAQLAEFFGL